MLIKVWWCFKYLTQTSRQNNSNQHKSLWFTCQTLLGTTVVQKYCLSELYFPNFDSVKKLKALWCLAHYKDTNISSQRSQTPTFSCKTVSALHSLKTLSLCLMQLLAAAVHSSLNINKHLQHNTVPTVSIMHLLVSHVSPSKSFSMSRLPTHICWETPLGSPPPPFQSAPVFV